MAKTKNWTGCKKGDRIRITNAAGRSWVGIFDRYNEVFGYIKLGKGEMLFGVDAFIEKVDKSVAIDPDDGIAPAFVNDIRGWSRTFNLKKEEDSGTD